MSTCWVLVANSARGTIYSANLQLEKLTAIHSFEHPESRVKVRELLSDDRGRTRAFPGGNHSAYEAPTDPHQAQGLVFARELGHALRAGRVANRYDHLVVVAPPRFLGLLRDQLDIDTRRLVWEELNHDWTGITHQRELTGLLQRGMSLAPPQR